MYDSMNTAPFHSNEIWLGLASEVKMKLGTYG